MIGFLAKNAIDGGVDLQEIIIRNKLKTIIRVFKEYKNRNQNQLNGDYESLVARNNSESLTSLLPSFKSGTEYKGNTKYGKMNGFGILEWKKGDNKRASLIGLFYLNSAHGYGVFNTINGFEYKGKFRNNKANGYGVYKHLNGEQYEGYWENNHQMKIGIETYSDGTQYRGEYSSGYKAGIGVCDWSDGSKYQGEWKNNSMCGFGIYHFKDGHVYWGQFEDNWMNGYGVMEWKDSKMYIGYFKRDKKANFGILMMPNYKPKAYIGYWKNNTQHGLGKVITDKSMKYGQWILGTREKTYAENTFFDILYKQSNERLSRFFKYNYKDLISFYKSNNQGNL